jgi:hypothetical protein
MFIDCNEHDLGAAINEEMDALWTLIRIRASTPVGIKLRTEFVLKLARDTQMMDKPADRRDWIAAIDTARAVKPPLQGWQCRPGYSVRHDMPNPLRSIPGIACAGVH